MWKVDCSGVNAEAERQVRRQLQKSGLEQSASVVGAGVASLHLARF